MRREVSQGGVLRAIAVVVVVAGAPACGSGVIATPDGAPSNDAAQATEVGSETSVHDAPADVAAEQDAVGSSVIAEAGDGDGDAACAYDGNIPNAGCCKTDRDCPTGTCCSGSGICIYCGPP